MTRLLARTVTLLTLLLSAGYTVAAPPVVRPGEQWLDTQGKVIQAHGGSILFWKHTYFWFGEDRTKTNAPEKRYVACYSSKDLVHWKFRHQVLAMDDPEHLGNKWVLERPKVFHNLRTGKFVMYAHLDNAPYKVASVAVAVSDRVDGDYKYVTSFRPLDQESRDIGQFIDDDGSAYLIFESRPTKGFYIARLSDDYMHVEKEMSFLHLPLEGGALVHYNGLYYVIGSHLSGWAPNPNVYATAPSLAGPWTEFQNIAPPAMKTYGSQSTMLLKVTGTKATNVIFMADIWHPHQLDDSRYLWMPLAIDKQCLLLPPPHEWTINVKTGEVGGLPPESRSCVAAQ